MTKILIIIDFQNDFCNTKIGSIPSKHAEEACQRFVPYLKEHYKDYNRIIYTLDTHYVQTYMNTVEGKKLPILHCIKGTVGHQLYPDLKALVAEIEKSGFDITGIEKNSFGKPNWNTLLAIGDEVSTEIDIVGCATDICVLTNAAVIKAYYPNAKINIIEKYCGGITKEDHDRAIKALERIHIDII